jgi:hypothetical protein
MRSPTADAQQWCTISPLGPVFLTAAFGLHLEGATPQLDDLAAHQYLLPFIDLQEQP